MSIVRQEGIRGVYRGLFPVVRTPLFPLSTPCIYIYTSIPRAHVAFCCVVDDAPGSQLRHPLHDIRHAQAVRTESDEGGPGIAVGRDVRDRVDRGLGDGLYDHASRVRAFCIL